MEPAALPRSRCSPKLVPTWQSSWLGAISCVRPHWEPATACSGTCSRVHYPRTRCWPSASRSPIVNCGVSRSIQLFTAFAVERQALEQGCRSCGPRGVHGSGLGFLRTPRCNSVWDRARFGNVKCLILRGRYLPCGSDTMAPRLEWGVSQQALAERRASSDARSLPRTQLPFSWRWVLGRTRLAGKREDCSVTASRRMANRTSPGRRRAGMRLPPGLS